MPTLNFELRGSVPVPEGTQIDGNYIVLPTGQRIKLWDAWEQEIDDGAEYRDLKWEELTMLGIDVVVGDFERDLNLESDK